MRKAVLCAVEALDETPLNCRDRRRGKRSPLPDLLPVIREGSPTVHDVGLLDPERIDVPNHSADVLHVHRVLENGNKVLAAIGFDRFGALSQCGGLLSHGRCHKWGLTPELRGATKWHPLERIVRFTSPAISAEE